MALDYTNASYALPRPEMQEGPRPPQKFSVVAAIILLSFQYFSISEYQIDNVFSYLYLCSLFLPAVVQEVLLGYFHEQTCFTPER